MILYKRKSLYQSQNLRRLRYGRGRGVHSPKAYCMIQSLVRPHASYYHFQEHTALFDTPLHRLVYRTVARLAPSNIVIIKQSKSLDKVIKLASSNTPITYDLPNNLENTLVVSRNIYDLEITENTYVIFTDIRRTKTAEEVFRKWVEKMPSGIILDLYDTALISGVEQVKYIYRTTL